MNEFISVLVPQKDSIMKSKAKPLDLNKWKSIICSKVLFCLLIQTVSKTTTMIK